MNSRILKRSNDQRRKLLFRDFTVMAPVKNLWSTKIKWCERNEKQEERPKISEITFSWIIANVGRTEANLKWWLPKELFNSTRHVLYELLAPLHRALSSLKPYRRRKTLLAPRICWPYPWTVPSTLPCFGAPTSTSWKSKWLRLRWKVTTLLPRGKTCPTPIKMITFSLQREVISEIKMIKKSLSRGACLALYRALPGVRSEAESSLGRSEITSASLTRFFIFKILLLWDYGAREITAINLRGWTRGWTSTEEVNIWECSPFAGASTF